MRRLGDVLLDIKPGFASRDDLDEGVFQFRMHNFTRESALDLTKRRRVNATSRQLEAQSVAAGDVLFNATNSPELVGKSAIIGHLDEPAVFSNHFMRLRTDPERLDSGYLAHFLRHQFARGVFRAMAKAWVNQATVARDRLEDLKIPLPSLPEQRRIAAILDHADALRAKRRQVLAFLDILTQSIFHDMFSGVSTEVPLAELVDEFRYGTSNKSGDAGWPALRIPNVVGGAIDTAEIKTVAVTKAELERLALHDGDLLFVRTNGNPDNVGRCAVFSRRAVAGARHQAAPWIYASYLIRARLRRRVHPQFVATFLGTQLGRKRLRDRSKTSAGQYNINIAGIGSVPVPDVSFDAQVTFASRLERVDRQRVAVHRALAADDELFASLQSRAFRGEL